ncbi:hypothetical protein COCVIDRAFT_37901 [Bipolaris victoriae FI3]|uniref:Uncharacterized protein n=1 Tax=Bipolaris victoriae (strain FI3) TaxID=930091 RepID=W7E982_BIPV3|nr:hypothetical protein COCVIDRAFT_37901 [Bipolaris victoriae FI3]
MCSFGSSSTALREVHWGVPRPSLRGKKLILTQVLARLLCDCCCFPSSSTLLPPSSFSLSLTQVSLTSLYIYTPIYIYKLRCCILPYSTLSLTVQSLFAGALLPAPAYIHIWTHLVSEDCF